MSSELVDTHCHIYSHHYKLDPDKVMQDAAQAGVTRLVCVGTDVEDSQEAVEFVQSRPNTWATIGIHPHEAKKYINKPKALKTFETLLARDKVVAIGECGLDYFYHESPEFTSPKEAQYELLKYQIELALKHDLPMTFHVRQAFDDFWPIFDSYKGIRGVIHSFTDSRQQLDEILRRGLFVGLNGITTFTKNPAYLEVVKAVPLNRLVVETDAPFLTPAPFRGTICEPRHVRVTSEFLAGLRNETYEQFATETTHNARQLFGLE